MAAIITAGTRENPLHVGGHWQLTRVNWSAGLFVVVLARAEYTTGELGSRKGVVAITTEGKKIGGAVVFTKQIHEPEDLVDKPDDPAHPPRSTFMAVLRFNRSFDTSKKEDAFTLTLSGSLKVTDPVTPVAGGDPFCGTTISTGVWSPTYVLPAGDNNTVIAQDVTWTTSSPAGSSAITYTNAPLSDVRTEDIGKGGFTLTGIDSAIWYQDIFGNFVNTHRPCSELPVPGGPTPPATKTEGWKLIQVASFPISHYRIIPVATWRSVMQPDAIVVPRVSDTQAFGGAMWQARLPQVVVGQNSDFLPIFDDLPQGAYGFRVVNVPFTAFVAQNPPQKKPTDTTTRWSLPCCFPTTPVFARYDFRIGTNKPPPYLEHATLPLADPDATPPFTSGVAPPSNQSFTP